MNKKKNTQFLVKNSDRAKRLRLAVYSDTQVVITVPKGASKILVEKFIVQKSEWIEEKVAYFSQFKNKQITKTSEADFVKNKSEALKLATERVEYFNQFYGFSFNQITVKNQKTRWGSCSTRGNINFNYKIIFLPEAVRDYIVVHELCHLKEFNHSRKFWNLISKTIPELSEIRNSLRKWEMTVQ